MKKYFRRAKKRADDARKSDGVVCVTCPASRHAQMIAENIGARKPYPMLQEEPEVCAEDILVTVAALYEARLLVAKNLALTAQETADLNAAADYLTSDGGSMSTLQADRLAAVLRALAFTHGPRTPVAASAGGVA